MRDRVGLAAVTAAALAASIALYWFAVLPAGPFGWDESSHAVYGLRQATHLRRGEWLAFLNENTSMGAWAFLHSWMLAPMYLIAGATVVHARLVSLICLVLFVPVLYCVAAECAPRSRRLAGGLACAFALTSPALLTYACRAMLEMPGVLVGWTALYVYLRTFRGDGESGPYVSAAVLAVLTMFTRYEYGFYLMGAMLAAEAVRFLATLLAPAGLRRQRIGVRLTNTVLLLLVFEAGVGFWWYYNEAFRDYALQLWLEMTHAYVPYTTQRMSLNRSWLLMSPTFIARDYTANWAAVALLLVGCAAALRRWRDLRRITLVLLFAVGYPVVFFKFPYPSDAQWWPLLDGARFLAMLVPVFWVLAALGIADVAENIGQRRPRAGAAVPLLAALVLAFGAFGIYGEVLAGRYSFAAQAKAIEPVHQALAAAFAGEKDPIRVYFVSGAAELPPGEVEWQIRQASGNGDVHLVWPAWPDNPREGYPARLHSLLNTAWSNWIVVTARRKVDGYGAAAGEQSDFARFGRFAQDDGFILEIYRRKSS